MFQRRRRFMNAPKQPMPLGIEGFSYADLYAPDRLRDLHDEFCAAVCRVRPGAVGRVGRVSRRARRLAPGPVSVEPDRADGAARQPLRCAGCSRSETPAGDLRAQTPPTGRPCSASSRFRPQAGAAAGQGRRARARAIPPTWRWSSAGRRRSSDLDGELAVARGRLRAAGSRGGACVNGGRTTEKAAVAAEIEALKRWCASLPARSRCSAAG